MSNHVPLNSLGAVYDSVIKRLMYNLNHWKRVNGDEHPEANKHFFTQVFPNEVLDSIRNISGIPLARWGTEGPKYRYSQNSNVGIRFVRDASEFDPRAQNLLAKDRTRRIGTRTADKNEFKPQLIVTIRPLHKYDKWFTRKKVKNRWEMIDQRLAKKAGLGDMPNSDGFKKYTDYYTESVTVVPIFVQLPLLTLPEDVVHVDDSGVPRIFAKEKSIFHHDAYGESPVSPDVVKSIISAQEAAKDWNGESW